MIKRNIDKFLVKLLKNFPAVGIIGPRQVGKTTLTKLLKNSIPKESIYIDLENPKDRAKLNDPVLFFESMIDKCVILDEIQRFPELFPILRSMIDAKREPSRFILLGSASPDIIRDSSESLAGRIAYCELSPFNITELNNNSFKNHWFRGGFPDAFQAIDEEIVYEWHYNFVKTYIERDLPLLGLNVDSKILEKLWTMISHLHGNILNYSNLGKSLSLSSTTIKKYLNFLENVFLIRQLQPFSPNIKKRIVKSPKVYIRDSGILHYLLNINSFNELEFHPIVGSSWEGYVIEQILQLSNYRLQGYYYRTHEGTECDLVLLKGNIPHVSIEIKYTSSPKTSKGMLQAFEDLKTTQNFIITPTTDDYLITKNIRVCNLFDFLSKHLNQIL